VNARYGCWSSPISAAMVAAGGRRLQQPQVHAGVILWAEGRPAEAGRITVTSVAPDGTRRDWVPAPHSVRSRINGYGGGAFAFDAQRQRLYFVDAKSQDIYVASADASPRRIGGTEGHAYGDLLLDLPRDRILCVRERMLGVDGDGPVEALVAMDLDDGAETVLRRGHDFYSYPTLSPDGSQLAYLSWNQPAMPWDETTLWLAELDRYGKVIEADAIAGGEGVSIASPWFDADGGLIYASDAREVGGTRRWQLYRHRHGGDGGDTALTDDAREHAAPQWVPGVHLVAQSVDGLLSASTADGAWRIDRITAGGSVPLDLPGITHVDHLTSDGRTVALIAGGPRIPPTLYRLGPGDVLEPLACSSDIALDAAQISAPEAIAFPSAGETAHGFLYLPVVPAGVTPEGGAPPLIVKCHGGPTAAAATTLELKVQYWTSRGFALLDLNYRGSTGFGRAYRERLYGGWGEVEVEDAAAGVAHLVERGLVDGDACFISGSSAGGYTVLRALMYTDAFRAGACYYGVSDLEAICADTTRFEARYGDQLIAPYPAERERYRALSPIHHAEDLLRPVIFFQGDQDDIVPPDQTRRMADALRERGVSCEEHHYPVEGHGFRGGAAIQHALEAELRFLQGQLARPEQR